jgi:peptidoglycan hydrolase CwlO-like protein
MKKSFVFAVASLLATVSATTLVNAASSVQVKVENKCGSPTPYVIQKKGSSLNTSLSPRASITHSLDAGDRIVVGKSVVHTVSAASAKQPVIVCDK